MEQPNTTTPSSPTFPEPIRILSDVHLGHPACTIQDPAELRPLFEGAATVIFNGDTTELRFLSMQESGGEYVDRLSEVCRDAGATPHFITGNHDPKISPIHHMDLLGGQVFITHGDILYHDIAPWSMESDFLRKAHDAALEGVEPDQLTELEARLMATKRASIAYELKEPHIPQGTFARIITHLEALWPPDRPFRIFRVWAETPDRAEAIAYAFRPHAKFVLIGHTHWAGVWKRNNRIIINTGGFTSFLGRNLVEIANGQLTVTKIQKKGNAFGFGRRLARFPLS